MGRRSTKQSSRPTSKQHPNFPARALVHRRRPLMLARAHRSCRATTTQLLSRPDATRTPVPSKGSGRRVCARRRKKTGVRPRAHARQHSSPLPRAPALGPAERPQPVLDCEPACAKHPASAPVPGCSRHGAVDGVFARVRHCSRGLRSTRRVLRKQRGSRCSARRRAAVARVASRGVAIAGRHGRGAARQQRADASCGRRIRVVSSLRPSVCGGCGFEVASVATEVSPVQDRPEDSVSSSRRRKPGSTPRSTRRLNSRPCRNSLTSSAAGGARSVCNQEPKRLQAQQQWRKAGISWRSWAAPAYRRTWEEAKR